MPDFRNSKENRTITLIGSFLPALCVPISRNFFPFLTLSILSFQCPSMSSYHPLRTTNDGDFGDFSFLDALTFDSKEPSLNITGKFCFFLQASDRSERQHADYLNRLQHSTEWTTKLGKSQRTLPRGGLLRQRS